MIKRNNPADHTQPDYLTYQEYFPTFVSTARYFPENICLTLYVDWYSGWEYRRNRSWKHYRKTQWKEE